LTKLTFQDVKDILMGCTILSTGGGGDLEKGLALVEEDFKKGREYNLVSLDEIDDDAIFTSPYFCGAIGTQEHDPLLKYEKIEELETVLAVQALEKYMGEKIPGIISIEYGGMNTAVAMSTASRLGKFIVDADAAGRAVPDLQFSTFYISEIPIYPLTVASKVGDIGVFEKFADDFRAEEVVRAIAVVSGGMVGMTDHPCSGKDLKRSVIPDALSYAEKIGKAQRVATEKGLDPIKEIISAGNGFHLFDGIVKRDAEWKIESGFTYGTIEINGVSNFKNHTMKIWFKNENIMCWLDEKVLVTPPDLICVVETETGYPITNPHCKKDMKVSVLGFRAHEIWRTERGLSILNPRFFGFEVDYVPIEIRIREV